LVGLPAGRVPLPAYFARAKWPAGSFCCFLSLFCMSKIYSLLAALGLAGLALGAGPAAGQTPLPSPGPRTCGTQAADTRQQAELKRRLPSYSTAKLAGSPGTKALRTAAVTYTLPVIVHIIHNGEAVGTGANISQAQVQSQIDVLNEDYRKLNADGTKVPSPFQPLRADAQFQFVLAARDPSGQPLAEPGIDRVSSGARGFTGAPYADYYIDGTIKPATSWNPDQYVNIWVLALPSNELGYAQFPDNTAGLAGLSGLGGAANTDGVVVTYTAFGRVGTLSATYNRGRTLTHEMGHWLGLIHIWGDANCGDDYCPDTPTQETGNLYCPSFPHVSCSNGPSGDMFMNYMDYVDDACMQMFSGNQKDRMQAVLAAGTPRRTILLTSPALCASTLSATASNSGAACPGSSVQLRASSPTGTAYNWYGPNGYTSTLQNPTLPSLTAAMAGTYTVLVSNGTGACPGTASTTVAVSPSPTQPVLATSATAQCPGTPVTLSAINLAAAGPLTYAWSLVSGDGLPTTINTATLTVSPTQNSVYRLTVSSAGFSCSASDTVGVRLAAPVWSGAAGNGNWFDAANWASGCVPTRATNASIPAGLATPYPTISAGTAEVRTLTQQGSLTLAGGELALYGDYAGTGALTQTGGTVATRGTSAQRLRPGAYQTLLIAGSGSKTIGAATIGQALTLAGPVLTTNAATLTLAPTARLNETETSYVLGNVQTTHILAITPDTFGGLGLTIAPASAPGATTVVRTTGQPQGVGVASSISRYFDIKAVASRGLLGATLTQQYQAHELNSLPESELVLFRSVDAGATWTNEGATQRDASAKTVTRTYVTDLQGRWTLASATAPPTLAAITSSISAFPVPFGTEGLSVQVTAATAGPLSIKLYDMLGRLLYDHPLATVEVGTSTVALPGVERLAPGKYVLVVQQGSQTARLNVVRQ
jgi:hypothetical protein